ncbi:MAG: hypothetical protein P8P74_03595 [Crocinitomicaceae bacterium]|nr:hypothetical protein [Crocinitomicaceae bacterium]
MKKWSLSKWTLALTMLIMVLVSNNLNWTRDHWKGVIESDAKGYFAYLPATFVYGDLNYGFYDKMEMEKYYDANFYFDYRFQTDEDRYYNKYFCGSAIAMSPFYMVAHVIANSSGYDSDGYSFPYIVSITLAALFYLFLGLLYLHKTLTLYEVSERNKSIVILAAAFGTNLFYYAIVEPGLSHIYSFAFVSMFIYFAKRYFTSFEKKYVIYLAAALAMIILIRPVNGLILFSLPLFAGSWPRLKNGLHQLIIHYKLLLASVVIGAAILSIQLLVYKLSTGQFLIYSYGTDRFYFLEPHIFDILFSYRKGLFLYTPIYFISMLGLFLLWQRRKFETIAFFGFFLLITYVLSSWWMWYYGGSFSSRVYVEYLPVFMVILALGLNQLKGRWSKIASVTLIVLLIGFCQFQTYQYRYGEIHWSEMTKDQYWNVFLRIDRLM